MKRVTEKIWEIAPVIPPEVNEELEAYPRILRQLLYNRGISTSEDAVIYLDQQGPRYDPFLMGGIGQAVERLTRALAASELIAVYGDYDVDGVTATALLVQVLRMLGGIVIAYIPDRFEEGYGLNNVALDRLAEKGVRLVVTVDCGIRSPAEAQHARELGLDLIISDHHEPKQDLPQAVALINPKQPGDNYPDKNLAGVGLAFKLAHALAISLREDKVRAEDWLDLVAVGTVADIVPLKGENRGLVKAGMELLRAGNRKGLYSLTGAAGLETAKHLTARDIGFVIGPRLNAAGRLESALAAYDLLMAESTDEAALLAQKLDDQNKERQRLTLGMQQEAEAIFADQEGVPYLIFAFKPEFEFSVSGLVGLVASRLTEAYYRPSIVACQENGFVRASCRSIPEFHITKALDECSDLLVRHGGHAMAAGFTVREENLAALMQNLDTIAERELAQLVLQPVLHADMELPLRDLRPEILEYLDRLEPTGLDNRGGAFVSRNLRVSRKFLMGKEKQHLKLVVTDGKLTFDAVAFRMGHLIESLPEYVDLLYSYERNVYMGRESLQLMVRDIKPATLKGGSN